MTYTLGIDIGTFESKGVLVNVETGAIVAQATHPHEMLVPRPGWAEHRPEEDILSTGVRWSVEIDRTARQRLPFRVAACQRQHVRSQFVQPPGRMPAYETRRTGDQNPRAC